MLRFIKWLWSLITGKGKPMLTEEEKNAAIHAKKILDPIIEKTGDAELIRAAKVLHERGNRYLRSGGDGDMVDARGGDT